MHFHQVNKHIDSDMAHKHMNGDYMDEHHVGLHSHWCMDSFVVMVHGINSSSYPSAITFLEDEIPHYYYYYYYYYSPLYISSYLCSNTFSGILTDMSC